jgi:hypothetical protein
MTKSKPITNTCKPSDYLRERRPERYSDSVITEEPQITRDILEYHLETLTNRSQEKEFEYFARRIAEKELCPNLLPQTGPTGGGDSKVDSETYPVAEEISLRWYQGNAGAKDRWAFAMSAKKEWKGKVKSDVKKIAETERGYALIYFITNQFVRDKARAQVEDDLKKEFGIEVRILDRSWIVDRIMNHGHIELAAQTLSIESLQLKPRKKIGPLDAKRDIELKELDTEINNPDRYIGIPYQLAEDILSAAVLASELERDRHEVDGRFLAALRIAEDVGNKRQILRIIYRQAWIACYVYDDINELSRLYNRVEELGLSSHHADDVELVNNLWNSLFGSLALGDVAINENPKLSERANALKKKLEELSNDDARPNNALHAQTMLCFHKLKEALSNNSELKGIKGIFAEFITIFERSRGLGQYPFDSYKSIIFELGNLFPDNDEYEKLFDTVVAIQEERTSEGEAGAVITNRGIQKLRSGKIYDAIRLFGRAQEKLAKEEYRHELIECLIACGRAYEAAGLNWAARSNLLATLSICITEFDNSGFLHPQALLAAKQLTWIEIRLGRVPHIFFSLSLTNFIASHLQLNEEGQTKYWEFIQHIDAIFSILILHLNLDQLEEIKKIPHLLDQLNLVCSEGTLLFALGHIDKLREDVWFDKEDSVEKIEEFYELVCAQPANEDLPDLPELCLGRTVELKSDVLGMNLIFHVDANQISIWLAESLLGALEAFLATSLMSGIMPYKQIAKVAIRIDEDLKEALGIELIKTSKKYELEVTHNKNFALSSADEIKRFRDLIMDFIVYLLPKIAIYDDKDNHFKKLAEDENVFSRALLFSDVITLSQNICGNLDWTSLREVSNSIEGEVYELKRKSQWKPKKKLEQANEPLKSGEGEPPEHIANAENLKHNERRILSLIDMPVWNEAQWTGMFFMVYPDGQFPPCIGLMFKNEDGARNIFKGWRERLGDKDEKDALRICIVTGVDKNNPAHYRTHLGTNANAYRRIGVQEQMVMVSRIQTMTPENDKNLNMFLEAYKKHGVYCLLPAIFQDGQPEPNIIRDMLLFKKLLIVKPAWQIGDNDEDLVVLQLDDEPIIPEDIKDAPVLRALERNKKMNKKR